MMHLRACAPLRCFWLRLCVACASARCSPRCVTDLDAITMQLSASRVARHVTATLVVRTCARPYGETTHGRPPVTRRGSVMHHSGTNPSAARPPRRKPVKNVAESTTDKVRCPRSVLAPLARREVSKKRGDLAPALCRADDGSEDAVGEST